MLAHITFLSYHLKKPISHFFPEKFSPEKNTDELSDLEKELIFLIKMYLIEMIN